MYATDHGLVTTARLVATLAHAGQVDKAGEPYINHPSRVVDRLEYGRYWDRAVAWLHDVVEDTPVTLDDLSPVFPPYLIHALDAITHRKDETNTDYYQRIRQSPIALRVKAADIADNADPERLARLDPATRDRLTAKYEKARQALGIAA